MSFTQHLAVTALALLVPLAARAATSYTPPAAAGGTASAGCLVQNVGSKSRTVTATLRDQGGAALDSATVDVAPGEVLTLAATTQQFGVYCEFEGLNRSVRGFLDVNDGGTILLLLPAGK